MEEIRRISSLLAIALLLGFAPMVEAQPQTAAEKIKGAMSAGPPAIAQHATILDRVDVAKARVLRRA
jgi:hypothetical protein